MKQIIGHRIALVVNAIILILAGLWYANSREIEPIIVFVASLGLLITGIFFHQKAEPQTQAADPQPQRDEAKTQAGKKTYKINNQGAKIGQQNIDSKVDNRGADFTNK